AHLHPLPRSPGHAAEWRGAATAGGAGRAREEGRNGAGEEAGGVAGIHRDAAAAVTDLTQPPLAAVRGKVALVSGGSRGSGLGLARAFRAAGMKVAFTWRRADHRDQALQWLGRDDPDVLALELDVTDRAGWSAAAAEVERVFGRVHLLACN